MKSLKLLLDLKHYDEAGRVKPASGLFCCVLFLSRTWLIFVLTIASGHDSNSILTWFYPKKNYLYLGMFIGLPAFFAYTIVSFREKLNQTMRIRLIKWVVFLLLISCMTDMAYHIYLANRNMWQFSWNISIVLLVDMLIMLYVLRDKHLRLLIYDWSRLDQP